MSPRLLTNKNVKDASLLRKFFARAGLVRDVDASSGLEQARQFRAQSLGSSEIVQVFGVQGLSLRHTQWGHFSLQSSVFRSGSLCDLQDIWI